MGTTLWQRTWRNVARNKAMYVMVIPGLLYLLVNNYLPMLGLVIAFKNVDFAKGIWHSDWIGFKNFEYLFKTSDAWLITRNTLGYNAVFIVVNFAFSIAIAIFLNEITSKFFSRFYQSVLLLPYLISMIIVSYLVFALLSQDTGMMNHTILPLFGIKEISWYNEPVYWPFILVIVNLWKNAGFLCVVFLAAIIGIDKEYYEAATLDGASKWKQIRLITIPLISPVIVMMLLLFIGRIFYADFGLFFQVPMESGPIMNATNVIDTYVYRGLMQIGDIGMSAAAGCYQSIVGFVLVLLSNYVVRKINKDQALF